MERRQLLSTAAIPVAASLVGCLGAAADGNESDVSESLGPRRSGHVVVDSTAAEPYHIDVTISSLGTERVGTPPNFASSTTIGPGDSIRAQNVVSRTGTYQIEAQTAGETIANEWEVEDPGRHGAGVAQITVEENGGLDVGILTFVDT